MLARLLRARGEVDLEPLTERILSKLPGSRRLWIGFSALIPWLNAGANLLLDTEGSVWEQSRSLVILNYAALSLAVVITLWGTQRIACRLETLRVDTSKVLQADEAGEPFRGMNSSLGPLFVSGAASIVFGFSVVADNGWLAGVLRGVTWFVLGVSFWTFLWTYVSLQLGLDRLGREHLRPDSVTADPGLGLRPLGDVAFIGPWMLVAWLVPLLPADGAPGHRGGDRWTARPGRRFGGVLLSFYRLHRQMVEVKARELAVARELDAQAYAPVRAEPTLEALEQQHRLLAAADSLEKRARAIHDWPIDEGTFARVLTIATSVIAVTIARLILDPFGL